MMSIWAYNLANWCQSGTADWAWWDAAESGQWLEEKQEVAGMKAESLPPYEWHGGMARSGEQNTEHILEPARGPAGVQFRPSSWPPLWRLLQLCPLCSSHLEVAHMHSHMERDLYSPTCNTPNQLSRTGQNSGKHSNGRITWGGHWESELHGSRPEPSGPEQESSSCSSNSGSTFYELTGDWRLHQSQSMPTQYRSGL